MTPEVGHRVLFRKAWSLGTRRGTALAFRNGRVLVEYDEWAGRRGLLSWCRPRQILAVLP